MILGIMSDTHGNRSLMFEVAELMTERFGVDTIYHAGDDYADAEELDFAGYRVRAVPGLWCPEYGAGRVPRRIVDRVDGITIAMTHADKDLRAVERAASVVITGHTHVATVEQVGASVYLNPGHLKAARDRGQDASFALIMTNEATIRFAVHEIDGRLRQKLVVPRVDLARPEA